MSARRLASTLAAIDTWRRRPVYRARVINSEIAAVVVKSARSLRVGKRISFARIVDLEKRLPEVWRSGVIWRIDKGCLHLTRT